MRIRREPLSRRAFLRGLLGASVALPLLEAMGPAFAEPGAARGRFLGLFMPNGVVFDDWFPRTQADGTLALARNMAVPIAPIAERVLIFRGVHNRANAGLERCDHASGVQSLLTGAPMYGHFAEDGARALGGTDQDAFAASGPSLDQILAARLAPPTPLDAIAVASRVSSFSQIAWLGDQTRRAPESDPLRIYAQLFGGVDPADTAALERTLRRRRSVLDAVGEDYARLTDEVGQADRERLEAHLDAIRGVETRLERFVVCTDAPPQPPELVTEADWVDVVTDLLVLALQCDITRFATLAFRACGGGQSYFPWLPGLVERDFDAPPEVQDAQYYENEHHEMSHRASRDEAARDKYHLIVEWYLTRYARLVTRLAEAPDGDGTSLLDHTLVLQGSENGLANGAHGHEHIPFLLAGNLGGQLRTGRLLDFSSANDGAGVTHNQLLLAIARAFGVEDDAIGLPELCSGGPLDLS